MSGLFKEIFFLNRLKAEVTSKYGLASQPRLVDIIAAVPVTHKKVLLPKLKVNIKKEYLVYGGDEGGEGGH